MNKDKLFWAFFAANSAILLPAITFLFNAVNSLTKDDRSDSEETRRIKKKVAVSATVVAMVFVIIIIVALYFNFFGTFSSETSINSGGSAVTQFPPAESQFLSANSGSNIIAGSTPETKQPLEIDKSRLVKLRDDDYSMYEASSTYQGDRASHIVANILDNNPQTNWTEGIQGGGEGEYIDFEFHMEQPLAGFVIMAGNHYDDRLYTANCRPSKIMLTFPDDSSKEFGIKDSKKEQTIYFDEIVYTNKVRMTIQSVNYGSSYDDTVISEFTFLVNEK